MWTSLKSLQSLGSPPGTRVDNCHVNLIVLTFTRRNWVNVFLDTERVKSDLVDQNNNIKMQRVVKSRLICMSEYDRRMSVVGGRPPPLPLPSPPLPGRQSAPLSRPGTTARIADPTNRLLPFTAVASHVFQF